MGHLTPVLVATEAFGRDMRKILQRYKAPPELERELEQNLSIWKASIRRFHDTASGNAACPANNKFVQPSELSRYVGETVVSELLDEVMNKHIPAAELDLVNRKLAAAQEKNRVLELQLHRADATNDIMQAQNDKQAESQLGLAHNMFEEVFQLRTTIAELSALTTADGTNTMKELLESIKKRHSHLLQSRARSGSSATTAPPAAGLAQDAFSASFANTSFANLLGQSNSNNSQSSASLSNLRHQQQQQNSINNKIIDIVKVDYVPPASESQPSVDVRSVVNPVPLSASLSASQQQEEQSHSSPPTSSSLSPSVTAAFESALKSIEQSTTSNFVPSSSSNNNNNNESGGLLSSSSSFSTLASPTQQQQVSKDISGIASVASSPSFSLQQHATQQQFLSPELEGSSGGGGTGRRKRATSFKAELVEEKNNNNNNNNEEGEGGGGGDVTPSSRNNNGESTTTPPFSSSTSFSISPGQQSSSSSSPNQNSQQQQYYSSSSVPNYNANAVGTSDSKRRINSTSGGIGPYAVFDYETFIENFEKTRGAKALAAQLADLKEAFAEYIRQSNLDRAGIASSYQFQLDAKNEQIAMLKLALLRALGTAPTLAKMVRSFLQTVLKLEVEQIKKRVIHLQKAVAVWIGHIQKHVSLMGARFDVFVRFCGNVFQELNNHVAYAVAQRFPLAPGCTHYAPPPNMEPMWHFFVLKGDSDPEEEAKAFWQNHESTQLIALMQTNMCEALKEIHSALRSAAQMKSSPTPTLQEILQLKVQKIQKQFGVSSGEEGGVTFATTNADGESSSSSSATAAAGGGSSSGTPSETSTQPHHQHHHHHAAKKVHTFQLLSKSEREKKEKEEKDKSSTPNSPSSTNLQRKHSTVRFTDELLSTTSATSATSGNDNITTKEDHNNNLYQNSLDNSVSSLNVSGIIRTPQRPSIDQQQSSSSPNSSPFQNRFASSFSKPKRQSLLSSPLRKVSVAPASSPLAASQSALEPIQPHNENKEAGASTRKRNLKSLYAGTSWESMDKHREGIDVNADAFQLKKRDSNAGGADWSASGTGNDLFFGGSQNASSSSSGAGGGGGGPIHFAGAQNKRKKKKYDDWTVESSVDNIKFLRSIAKRCTQLSVRNILIRVHLRARRNMLLKKMSPAERNAYLTVAALDREVAHVTDVIDGARGNGYLAKFRALETEHIIQAWRSTGRRGKPVITGDSDEDDPRVIPPHAPGHGVVPVRNMEKIRGDLESAKEKDQIQKFRTTLGKTGGTSYDDNADDGTFGDPIKLVHEMITTGTLWASSTLGRDAKGAYRARQDVLLELVERETQRLNSQEGFNTRRKRRFMRMLLYLKNKIGYAESAIHAARSGATSTAVQEGTGLLEQFLNEFGVPEQEMDECDQLDAARRDVLIHQKAADLHYNRNKFRQDGLGGRTSSGKFSSKPGEQMGVEGFKNRSGSNAFSTTIPQAVDGSSRWRVSRKEGGTIQNVLHSISDTVTTNRADYFAMQRLGLTEEQMNMIRIQSLRKTSAMQQAPSDLSQFLFYVSNGLSPSPRGSDANNNNNNIPQPPQADEQQKQVRALIDEAVSKLREDLLFGRDNTELWFAVNDALWIPTPGSGDIPSEVQSASRDMQIRRAMTALLAVGAVKSDQEDVRRRKRKFRRLARKERRKAEKRLERESKRLAGEYVSDSDEETYLEEEEQGGGGEEKDLGSDVSSGLDDDFSDDKEEKKSKNNTSQDNQQQQNKKQMPQTFTVREASIPADENEVASFLINTHALSRKKDDQDENEDDNEEGEEDIVVSLKGPDPVIASAAATAAASSSHRHSPSINNKKK